jgi:putative transcription factor
MVCDLCGKTGTLYKTEIEGSRVNACESCAKYGKVLHEIKTEQTRKQFRDSKERVQSVAKTPEVIQLIVKNYGQKIKNARESRNLKQEDFAKLINEKESLLHHLESGKMEPNLELAKKLEKALGIKLIEEMVLEPEEQKQNIKASGPMTLGDMINIKKR